MFGDKKGDSIVNKFLEQFAGVEVEIFTGLIQKFEVTTPDGTSQEDAPIVVRGYILDIDDKWIYLGTSTAGIDKAIAFGPGLIIEAIKPHNEFDDMLDNMPTPVKGGEN